MSRKLPHRFGNIPKKIWEKLEGKEKQFLFKYNWYREKIDKINDEIDDYRVIIDNLRKERKKCEMRSNDIWNENKHLNENYSLTYNISTNNKYTSISKRKGFNKEGKSKTQLLKERKFIGKYWLINFKYRGKSKSIHIGEDKSVKEFLKTNDDLNDIPKNLTEEEIRNYISYLIEDNLYDLVYGDMMGKYDIYKKKISFNNLIK
ncbi:hypothetical protein N9D50_06370 [Flavobacteriaceae bacterium]|nr:hypothetical protein [Flavobacteriaceae bacterium]